MTVIRRKVSRHFTIITNNCFEDLSLSGELLGLLTYLLSRPNNWKIRPQPLARRMGWGRDKTYNALNSLVDLMYIERRQLRDERNGKFQAFEYIVYDERVAGLSSEPGPVTEIPPPENQKAAKRINTKSQKIFPPKSPHRCPDEGGSPLKGGSAPPDEGIPPLVRPFQQERPQPWAKRGRFEAELALRLGKDGWNLLSCLTDEQLTRLCREQSSGQISDRRILELRMGYLQNGGRSL